MILHECLLGGAVDSQREPRAPEVPHDAPESGLAVSLIAEMVHLIELPHDEAVIWSELKRLELSTSASVAGKHPCYHLAMLL